MDTSVSGWPRKILRVEGLVVLVASVVAYGTLDASWGRFAALLLLPDLALLGYLAGPQVRQLLPGHAPRLGGSTVCVRSCAPGGPGSPVSV